VEGFRFAVEEEDSDEGVIEARCVVSRLIFDFLRAFRRARRASSGVGVGVPGGIAVDVMRG
jgi:hypothetical protein